MNASKGNVSFLVSLFTLALWTHLWIVLWQACSYSVFFLRSVTGSHIQSTQTGTDLAKVLIECNMKLLLFLKLYRFLHIKVHLDFIWYSDYEDWIFCYWMTFPRAYYQKLYKFDVCTPLSLEISVHSQTHHFIQCHTHPSIVGTCSLPSVLITATMLW